MQEIADPRLSGGGGGGGGGTLPPDDTPFGFDGGSTRPAGKGRGGGGGGAADLAREMDEQLSPIT